jgi:hypothetical protein
MRHAVLEDAAEIARIHVDKWSYTFGGNLLGQVLLNMYSTRNGGGWSGSAKYTLGPGIRA